MTAREKKYLSDILSAIYLIEDFICDTDTFQKFSSDKKTISAVERQLAIIGEAVGQYSQAHKQEPLKHARQIIGMRNWLVHSYDSIDLTTIWAVVKLHLPELKTEVKQLLPPD